MTGSDPQDPNEGRGNTPFVGLGIAFVAGLGVLVFAVTQNPVWIGIGAGLGIVVGAVLDASRQ